ncbi:MAG: KEOPS complex kinase/ATPase Bud32 [Nanoarchaeota archaeon]
MTQIAQGAEAKLFKTGNIILKDRFTKKYRHPELDFKLRKARTKKESKILIKMKELNIPSSEYINHDEKEMKIEMKFVDGEILKTVFDSNFEKHSKLIGANIALMHKNDLIHGDLTTSNMILNNDTLHFIDFGLSFNSDKIEDKAVDLHLLRQALESKHFKVVEKAFKIVLSEYSKNYGKAKEVIERLNIVEKRGRHKQQY